MKSDYSQAEIKLFEVLGFETLLDMDPVTAYLLAVRRAFEKNLQGSPVEALRRAAIALKKFKPWRMTLEWDAMIVFNNADVKGLTDIIDAIKADRDDYKSPGRYQESDWYLKCDAKVEVLSGVLDRFGVS